MLRVLRRFIGWLIFWRNTPEQPEAAKEESAERIPVAKKEKKKTTEENLGEYYFRDAILDQLENYFRCIKRMKRCDPESYDLYSQIGAHIIPTKLVLAEAASELSPWWKQTLPAFGAFAYGTSPVIEEAEKKGKYLVPRFMYFRKYDTCRMPADLQPVFSGSVYVCTVYWDDPKGMKLKTGLPSEFGVVVERDGTVRVLRSRITTQQTIRCRHGKGRGKTFSIPQTKWGHQEFFKTWAKEREAESVENHLAKMFRITALTFETANSSMVRVDAERNGLHAVFAVNIKRTPYFFRDRDVTLNDNGKRKRIFHIARPHSRITANGKETYVRMHFRGERSFHWNEYNIKITVPEMHHTSMSEFNVGLVDVDPEIGEEASMDMEQTGRVLREHLGKDLSARWRGKNAEDNITDAGTV